MRARSPVTGRFAERADLDRPEIRRRYESGEISIRAIARRFDTSDGVIRKFAERELWSRPAHLRPQPKVAAARRSESADPGLDGLCGDIVSTFNLVKAMRAGLRRIVAGKAQPGDAQLLRKSGSVIDALGVLVAAQTRLILLHHKTAELRAAEPEDPTLEMVRREAMLYEMAQVTGGDWTQGFHRRLDELYYRHLDEKVAKELPARIRRGREGVGGDFLVLLLLSARPPHPNPLPPGEREKKKGAIESPLLLWERVG